MNVDKHPYELLLLHMANFLAMYDIRAICEAHESYRRWRSFFDEDENQAQKNYLEHMDNMLEGIMYRASNYFKMGIEALHEKNIPCRGCKRCVELLNQSDVNENSN